MTPAEKIGRTSAHESECAIVADFGRNEGACEFFHEAMRFKIRHVPTRSVAPSLRNVASTESATMRPVLGFSDGTFSIDSVNEAESASTSITWQFRVLAGSA